MVLLSKVQVRRPRAGWLRKHWLRILVHVGALLPLAWILWNYAQGAFLVDPVREITTLTGRVSIILVVLTLACTPINTVFGFRQVLRVRRTLGLYAFLYVGLHFLTFAWLDYALDLPLILGAIFDQRYVLVGFASGLILLLLALTSTKGWQRRLGKRWKQIHRLIYMAGILAVVHYLWLAKDARDPLRYGILVAILLALRIPQIRRAVSSTRHKLQSKWKTSGSPKAAA
jgi:sulfoxide reductase heme-binding subunit YedZ